MIIGVAVVRNEADIIETMVRQNLHFLDHLVIFDNDSVDETPQIVERLREEGLACELRLDTRRNHVQNVILTEFLNLCKDEFEVDRVILLDADEIIKGDRSKFIAEMSNATDPISLPWTTYVPTATDNPSARSILSRITYRRKSEAPQFFKATVPRHYLGSVTLELGSHGFKSNGKKVKQNPSKTSALAHFPVRTSEQLLSKILLGAWNVRTREHSSSEAYHWIALSNRFRTSLRIEPDQLFEVARTYAADGEVELVHDPIEVCFDEGKVRSVDSPNRLLEDVVRFTEELVCRVEPKKSVRRRIGHAFRTRVLRRPSKHQ